MWVVERTHNDEISYYRSNKLKGDKTIAIFVYDIKIAGQFGAPELAEVNIQFNKLIGTPGQFKVVEVTE